MGLCESEGAAAERAPAAIGRSRAQALQFKSSRRFNRASDGQTEDPVFAGRDGKPLCENAIVQRHLKPAGRKLGMPRLAWHDLRRTFATLADQEKISIGERKELMGHGRAEMALHYTHVPTERASEVLERMSEKIVAAAGLRPGETEGSSHEERRWRGESTEFLSR